MAPNYRRPPSSSPFMPCRISKIRWSIQVSNRCTPWSGSILLSRSSSPSSMNAPLNSVYLTWRSNRPPSSSCLASKQMAVTSPQWCSTSSQTIWLTDWARCRRPWSTIKGRSNMQRRLSMTLRSNGHISAQISFEFARNWSMRWKAPILISISLRMYRCRPMETRHSKRVHWDPCHKSKIRSWSTTPSCLRIAPSSTARSSSNPLANSKTRCSSRRPRRIRDKLREEIIIHSFSSPGYHRSATSLASDAKKRLSHTMPMVLSPTEKCPSSSTWCSSNRICRSKALLLNSNISCQWMTIQIKWIKIRR